METKKEEQMSLQVEKEGFEKKRSNTQNFSPPKRECGFCGRITIHSANGKVCLVCGLLDNNY